jgi:hypothetical protein
LFTPYSGDPRTAIIQSMRGIFVPLMVLAAALIAALGLLIFKPQSWSQVTAAVAGVIAPAKPAATAAARTDSTPLEARRKPHARESAAGREGSEAAAAPLLAVPATPRPFPLPGDILPGTARSAVFARFGPPEAAVTGADLGKLRERLIYIDKANGRRTHIFLLNGNVTGTETLAQ